VYAAFKSRVNSHSLVALYAIKTSKRFIISISLCNGGPDGTRKNKVVEPFLEILSRHSTESSVKTKEILSGYKINTPRVDPGKFRCDTAQSNVIGYVYFILTYLLTHSLTHSMVQGIP
jgi:hypothetical protein